MRTLSVLMLLVILNGCSESSKETKVAQQNTAKPQSGVSISVADKKVFLTIEYYQVEKDAYSGVTPINSVLGVPKTVKWNKARCFADQKEDEQTEDLICHAELKPLISKCKNEIQLLMNEIPQKYEVLDGEGPLGSVIRFNKSGGEFFALRNYYGGTGGGRYDWRLYLLKWKKKTIINVLRHHFFLAWRLPQVHFRGKNPIAKKKSVQSSA